MKHFEKDNKIAALVERISKPVLSTTSSSATLKTPRTPKEFEKLIITAPNPPTLVHHQGGGTLTPNKGKSTSKSGVLMEPSELMRASPRISAPMQSVVLFHQES